MPESIDLPRGEGWTVRELRPADAPALQDLFEAGADYFERCYGVPPGPAEGESAFVALPDGANREDKSLYGVFDDGGSLVGVVDAVRGWPQADTLMLGLLLVAPEWRDRGVGAAVLEGMADAWRAAGMRRIRVGVVRRNARALAFYSRLGFTEAERVVRRLGTADREIVVLVRKLAAGGEPDGAARTLFAPVVVFDMDGTLLDSQEACVSALRQALDVFGVHVELDETELALVMARPSDERYATVLPADRAQDEARFREAVRAFERETVPAKARPFQGALEALTALRERGCRLALVTDSSPAYFELAREALGARGVFGYEACTGQEGRSKAELISEAVRVLGGGPATVVGDRARDVEAARAAGARAVLVSWGWPDDAEAAPDVKVGSFEELVAEAGCV